MAYFSLLALGNGFENQGHDIIVELGFKLVANMFQEGRDACLEVFIGGLIKGKLPVRWITHISNNVDAPVIIIEIEPVHLFRIPLPHYPPIREHLPDELGEFGPEGDWLADGKVTVAAITAGIHNDTLILLTEFSVKCFFKINRVRTGEAVKHNFILAISHCLKRFWS